MIEPLLIGAGAGLSLFAAGLNYAALSPSCQWFGPVICRGDRNGPRRLALTFDDGPSPGHTETILGILERYNIKACFFSIGRNVADAPQLLSEIHHAGHLIANHSYDHATLGAFHGRRYWVDQLQRTNDVIHETIGVVPRLFRPPMGIKTPRVLYAPKQLGMITVNWSHRGFDTRAQAAERIVRRATRRLEPGSVLMLHDGLDPSRPERVPLAPQALPEIIEAALNQGYTFDRLERALQVQGYKEST